MKKSPHLDLAHRYWQEHLQKGDFAVDATCGNGHDALFLAQLAITQDSGGIFCYDIQEKAIASTQELLQKSLPQENSERITFFQKCHSNFSDIPSQIPVRLIVYNLGYLPLSDKKVTTQTSSTMQSIEKALQKIQPGGALSITAYPGHEEGRKEESALLEFVEKLDSSKYCICYHCWPNRKLSPTLFWILFRG